MSCHAKDLAFIPEMNVHFKEVVPGTGQVDYATYLRELSKLSVDAPLMLEHLQTAEEYDAGRAYITVGRRPHRRRVRVAPRVRPAGVSDLHELRRLIRASSSGAA